MAVPRIAARGYQVAGDDYERARPVYPAEAINLLKRELPIRERGTVLDLGAGTGKLTRQLISTRASLLAVEPVLAMAAHLRRAVPSARVVAATAEAIPVANRSVDAVVAGTAFHWFRGERALAEIARVLQAGGGLGLVWNNPETEVDWVAQVWGLVAEYRGDAPSNRTLRWQDAFEQTSSFTPLQHRRFSHAQQVGVDDVAARVASISWIAVLAEAERAEVLRRVRAAVTAHPDLAGRDRFPLPYRTDVYWCWRG
ncbi:MAG: class I SAM-dependent methyltransferase [Actinomycetota bacterium]|nr:class I SAM-dependent methyltransferase [Actinomycetota bacterium]